VTPGPGYYRLPSDFGYYESKKTKGIVTNRRRLSTGGGSRKKLATAGGSRKQL
jgi:hypothetical protein